MIIIIPCLSGKPMTLSHRVSESKINSLPLKSFALRYFRAKLVRDLTDILSWISF